MAHMARYWTEGQNCMYYFCLKTHHKTYGTNQKIIFQGFIFALALHLLPTQNYDVV